MERAVLYLWDNTTNNVLSINQPSVNSALAIAPLADAQGHDLLSIVADGEMVYNQAQSYEAVELLLPALR
jgi:hypothetical protein